MRNDRSRRRTERLRFPDMMVILKVECSRCAVSGRLKRSRFQKEGEKLTLVIKLEYCTCSVKVR